MVIKASSAGPFVQYHARVRFRMVQTFLLFYCFLIPADLFLTLFYYSGALTASPIRPVLRCLRFHLLAFKESRPLTGYISLAVLELEFKLPDPPTRHAVLGLEMGKF